MAKNKIILVCMNCNSRNYLLRISAFAVKNLNLNKYCSLCQKHTLHYGNK